MSFRMAALIGASVMAMVQGVAAQDRTVVVELFTSQGCSSCPPADTFLGELAERPDVLALSLHVDYWDYLGWRDPFASPAITARQRGYAAEQGTRSVFTPQMIVDGRISAVGHRREDVFAAIAQAAAEEPRAVVELTEEGGRLAIRITPAREGLRGVVHFISYDHPKTQQITQGENRGHTLSYTNVVTDWMTLGTWNGTEEVLTAPSPTMGRGVAVIVQDGPVGAVLAAARLER